MEGGGGEGGVGSASFFCNRLFFWNHFEELQTVLFEVELVINNAVLTYVYPNTIATSLTPNHLLFGKQMLYSSNTTSTVVRNLTTSVIIFWIGGDMNLRETQRTSKLNIDSLKINVNDIVLAFL